MQHLQQLIDYIKEEEKEHYMQSAKQQRSNHIYKIAKKAQIELNTLLLEIQDLLTKKG